jgi:tetratricopeptide (TPR) repeat protein
MRWKIDHNDTKAVTHALQKAGHAYADLSRYQNAILYQQQALTLARISVDPNSEWDALRILGMTYRSIGNSTEAVNYLEQAMKIVTTLADTKKEGMILESLAVVYRNIGRTEGSLTPCYAQ